MSQTARTLSSLIFDWNLLFFQCLRSSGRGVSWAAASPPSLGRRGVSWAAASPPDDVFLSLLSPPKGHRRRRRWPGGDVGREGHQATRSISVVEPHVRPWQHVRLLLCLLPPLLLTSWPRSAGQRIQEDVQVIRGRRRARSGGCGRPRLLRRRPRGPSWRLPAHAFGRMPAHLFRRRRALSASAKRRPAPATDPLAALIRRLFAGGGGGATAATAFLEEDAAVDISTHSWTSDVPLDAPSG